MKNKISLEIEKIFPKKTIKSYTYGDWWLAARYCGFKRIPAKINGEWQHGHIIPERNIHPEFVIGSDGLSRTRKQNPYFVARQDQVDYLKSQHYSNVLAIGLPIIYVDKPNEERIKGSLLVMPMHTLPETSEDYEEEQYANYIESIAHNFTYIVCCVHKGCFDKGYWIDTFRKRNIEVILGADPSDANTLDRLAHLFSRFEYVTSNDFGSQLAYAGFFGAKPSIAGPRPSWKPADYSGVKFYQNAPELLTILNDWRINDFLKTRYPFLYTEPQHAGLAVEWANFQLGFNCKRSPSELRTIFKWNVRELFKLKIQKAYRLIPVGLRRKLKLMLDRKLRNEDRMIREVKSIPRYTSSTTMLLGHPFKLVDAPSFLSMHQDIFSSELYKFNTFSENPYIIDAGANIGLGVIYFKKQYPNAEVVAFEPDTTIFNVLVENVKSFDLKNVTLSNRALWNTETELEFFIEGADSGRVANQNDTKSTSKVPTIRLRTFLENKVVDFLKIDIEGAETKVLEDCSDLLPNVKNIFVEYHSFVGQEQTLPLLLSILKEAGFRLNINMPGLVSKKPFQKINTYNGMDMQLNIYGVRNN